MRARNALRVGIVPVVAVASIVAMAMPGWTTEIRNVDASGDMADLRGRTVVLRRGSIDGLGPAIAAAGPGGTVIVQRGVHMESGTVEITAPVTILGKRGAIIKSDTTPDPDYPIVAEPALHIHDTWDVTVKGLDLRPVGPAGNTAIVIENTRGVLIAGNTITDYQFGLFNEHGDRTEVTGNVLSMSTLWFDGTLPEADGILNINGRSMRITENTVTNATLGIFTSDRSGKASGNSMSNNLIGLILCKFPGGVLEISGRIVQAVNPSIEWEVTGNFAAGNFYAGYMVTDGSNNNILSRNAASGNAVWDIELLGDSCFFGFFMPTTWENEVVSGPHTSLTVNDCGVDNTIVGTAVSNVCPVPPPTSCP